jgi:hypothetical protein
MECPVGYSPQGHRIRPDSNRYHWGRLLRLTNKIAWPRDCSTFSWLPVLRTVSV